MRHPKTVEQTGAVYEYVPKATQQEAMAFLNKNIFTTPAWLINTEISGKTGNDPVVYNRLHAWKGYLNALLSTGRMNKLISAEASLGNNTYTLTDLMERLAEKYLDRTVHPQTH